jgi:4-alpha-glucanotransferase
VTAPVTTRRSGLLIPLFSIPSSRSWGIGEIGDIEPVAAWLERAGQRVLLTLPINEVPLQESSPYSALSAMAIDPQFISLEPMEDFAAIGAVRALEGPLRERLDAVCAARSIDYASVRHLKHAALRRSFAHFLHAEWRTESARASRFREWAAEQAWWLEDYALFRALHAHFDERAWTEWPDAIRHRHPEALERAASELSEDVLYRKYLQWTAGEQWAAARARSGGVALFGDLPFVVSADSADVWARQDEFRLDLSVGVPPDAFSATGQNWGLPAYRWDVMAERDFLWLSQRARRNANLFDGYRVDHLVGFYRMYTRPIGGGPGTFSPPQQPEQEALGERVLATFRAGGADIIAEDLGIVPDFVRASLARLGVPGYKVFRWEREWHAAGQPFRDPAHYATASVATSGTHDTEPLAIWWETAPREERQAILAIPSIRARTSPEDLARLVDAEELPPSLRETLIETMIASGSDLVVLPIQDVFGWRDRINQPATVGQQNWTWKLPWPSDRLLTEPAAVEMATLLRDWATRHGRR